MRRQVREGDVLRAGELGHVSVPLGDTHFDFARGRRSAVVAREPILGGRHPRELRHIEQVARAGD